MEQQAIVLVGYIQVLVVRRKTHAGGLVGPLVALQNGEELTLIAASMNASILSTIFSKVDYIVISTRDLVNLVRLTFEQAALSGSEDKRFAV